MSTAGRVLIVDFGALAAGARASVVTALGSARQSLARA
jgi:hypothetical protein